MGRWLASVTKAAARTKRRRRFMTNLLGKKGNPESPFYPRQSAIARNIRSDRNPQTPDD
jgi:hypothetical protein